MTNTLRTARPGPRHHGTRPRVAIGGSQFVQASPCPVCGLVDRECGLVRGELGTGRTIDDGPE